MDHWPVIHSSFSICINVSLKMTIPLSVRWITSQYVWYQYHNYLKTKLVFRKLSKFLFG